MARTIVAFTLCAFRTLMFDGDPFPPPPDPNYIPSTSEQFFAFMLGYLLLVGVLLLVLPKKWADTVFEIAFRPKPKSKESGL